MFVSSNQIKQMRTQVLTADLNNEVVNCLDPKETLMTVFKGFFTEVHCIEVINGFITADDLLMMEVTPEADAYEKMDEDKTLYHCRVVLADGFVHKNANIRNELQLHGYESMNEVLCRVVLALCDVTHRDEEHKNDWLACVVNYQLFHSTYSGLTYETRYEIAKKFYGNIEYSELDLKYRPKVNPNNPIMRPFLMSYKKYGR